MAAEMHPLLACLCGWAAQRCSQPTEAQYELGTTLIQLPLQILTLPFSFPLSDKIFPTVTVTLLLCSNNNLQVIW